jgi:hypothetical protein
VEVTPEEWARHQPGQRVAYRERPYGGYDLLPADSLPACIQWRAGQAAAPADSLGCTPPPADVTPAAPRDSTADSAAAPRDSAAADSAS